MSPLAEDANLLSTSDPNNVRKWLASHHPKQLSMLDKFEIELRLGRLSTSSTAAARTSSLGEVGMFGTTDRRLVTSRTVELLKSLIGSTRWRNAAQLLILLRGIGKELHAAGGFREPAIGNVVRRVMAAVREETLNEEPSDSAKKSAVAGVDMESIDELEDSMDNMSLKRNAGVGGSTSRSTKMSLTNMLWDHPLGIKRSSSGRHRSDSFSSMGSDSPLPSSETGQFPPIYYANRPDLRQSVMEAIQEIMSDLEDLHKNINDQATSHIHAGEIILTYGRSKTVELFLKAAAAKKRKFQVVVCEGAPHFGGHAMAKSLAEAGIDTTVINDSATFAIMARVNKVLLPSHAVLANGGLIAPSGSNMVALAAKNNSVPVVCVGGMFKLCPMYPHEGQDTLQDLVSPSAVIDLAEMGDKLVSEVEFVNPVHDYILPQNISLYITNIGAFQSSYIYRLLAEYYHSDDWESFE
mmetsp:Transcript_28174/g.39630  ORF Transcript_28174/g.39630 Transcript_28174/m.39630 type:complete len:466 (+) Transcript_28174:148-1545(+)